MRLNWNFQRGGGSYQKSLLWGRYGYFIELHIFKKFCFQLQSVGGRPIWIKKVTQLSVDSAFGIQLQQVVIGYTYRCDLKLAISPNSSDF